jgi:hypothetical protein
MLPRRHAEAGQLAPRIGRALKAPILDACTVKPYIADVRVRSVQHRGLLRLIEETTRGSLPRTW